ncbi:hypothetical protein [Actinoplanes teichomyceticus]|uniref:Uncharacterized protein n=1 Tax=Actinoplanes teichomyceticus TaxID=1867 RepID=A0A561WMZ9_ACTTI|nr:hypothetical protein [Actinoplanes teichomyceticus]TWG25252.1 hypothetical protein FHX34_101218 [Actinoplanes teichomyceticus]GIF10321.1 hypothetical protein Ate01nite_03530 [Actinoplanes teichomyceticus]
MSESPVEDEIVGTDYAADAVREPNSYRADRGSAEDPGLSSTIAAGTDPEELRNGGPATGGVMTTTGGTAGPASFPDRPRTGPGVANTTTGDATTGALHTPADQYTSDSAG